METLKTMSVFLMLLIALSLSIGGLWHQLQGGSMFYTLIGLLYGLSLNFYFKKRWCFKKYAETKQVEF